MTIGVFDSGVGGLWILKHLQEALPLYNYVFFGDQVHVPYGDRSIKEIRDFSEEITKFLINQDCKIIVIACNTASTASLRYLREEFPNVFFVGMEPAVKPAVENTTTKKVGVLATPATFQGELYNSVVERFAHDVEIYTDTCRGLVEQIEKGDFSGDETKNILKKALLPMIEKKIDTIVLGCTHYPFIIPLIKEITKNKIKIIDPTEAIVRRVSFLINENNLNEVVNKKEKFDIYTSGFTDDLKIILIKLFNEEIKINKLEWDNKLKLNNK